MSSPAYELEFDITQLLHELLQPRRTTTRETSENAANRETRENAANRETSDNAATSRDTRETRAREPNESSIQRTQNMIDELIYRYNMQMDRYHQNIERLIQLIYYTQSRTQPTPSIRQNRMSELLNNRSTLLYTYLYPMQSNTRPHRPSITAEQRTNAIETVQYDANTMPDNICPISLLTFSQGENVSRIKHCRHIFKTDSLNHWLTNYSTCCPVCRYDINTYRVNPNLNRNQTNQHFDYESDDNGTENDDQ